MSDPFERMNKSIFARLGKDAFLRGSPCMATVSHGVEVVLAGDVSDVVAHKTVVDVYYVGLSKPVAGDTVNIGGTIPPGGTTPVGGKNYKLDALLKDDTLSARWVVL